MPSLERFFNPQMRVFSANITSLPSAKLYFFEAGSTTPKVTYADKQGTIPNTNPVIASATGSFPPIFLDGLYRVELRSSGDIVQSGWPIDNVGQDSQIVPYAPWSEIVTYAKFERVTDPLTGIVYRSKVDNNLGNVPATSPAQWEVVIDPVPSSFTSDAAYLSWSDDGGQISLDVDPVAFADNFISSESYFSFSNATGNVSLDVDISGLSDAVAADLLITRQAVDISADGDLSGNIRCVKIGNTVTITATTTLLHSSNSAPFSNDGLIPVGYRPLSDVGVCYTVNRTLGYLASLNILSGGRITIEYNDFAGAGVSRTSSQAFSISYNI